MMASDLWYGLFAWRFPKWHQAMMVVKAERIKLREMEANALRIIKPDANARNGIAWDGVTFRNLDSGAVYGMIGAAVRDAVSERFDRLERLMIAAGPSGTSKATEALPVAAQVVLPALPQYVTLDHLCKKYNFKPSYHNIMIGETVNPVTGQYEIVHGDMVDFVHCLITGMTGFGKSWQLRALAKQLVVAGDSDLCFVDYGVNTFGRMAHHGLYPIADTPEMTIALFRILVQEMHKRREKMSEYPEAEKLDQYNQVSGDNLRPIVLFCDEASVLFDKSSQIRSLARDLTGMGRKYGIGCAFGGTDMKVTTMPSETRGNCGLRMAMHLEEPQLSRSIIHSTGAVNLMDKGRALVRLPGVVGLREVQCPAVERWDDLPDKREQIVLRSELKADRSADKIDSVLELKAAGASDTAIARKVFGHGTTHYIEKVRGILQQQHNNGDDDAKIAV